jgi:flagellar biosynthesis protein FlhB
MCLPFVFNVVLTGIVASIIIGGAALASISSMVPYFESLDARAYDGFLQLLPKILQGMRIIIIALIVTIILGMVIDAFFWAGAIGMAKEATETGQTNLSHMVEYGKRKYLSLFVTKLIIGLLAFVGVVFLIPGIAHIFP